MYPTDFACSHFYTYYIILAKISEDATPSECRIGRLTLRINLLNILNVIAGAIAPVKLEDRKLNRSEEWKIAEHT